MLNVKTFYNGITIIIFSTGIDFFNYSYVPVLAPIEIYIIILFLFHKQNKNS